jgi:hypothetical protein
MNTTDLAVGAAVGFVLGIFGNYIFEGWGFRARAAKLSERRARARSEALKASLEEARKYSEDKLSLVALVVTRVLLVNVLWIGQEVVDYFLGLGSNATQTYSILGNPAFRSDAVVTTVSTVGSLVGIVLLGLIARIGLRTYRVARRALGFTGYSARVNAELAELAAVISPEPAVTSAAAGGRVEESAGPTGSENNPPRPA